MHRLDLIEASLNYSAAMFQHSDTNNVLKNALPIINHFTKCRTVSNSAANYSVHCFFSSKPLCSIPQKMIERTLEKKRVKPVLLLRFNGFTINQPKDI